jgi:hypothetical protein
LTQARPGGSAVPHSYRRRPGGWHTTNRPFAMAEARGTARRQQALSSWRHRRSLRLPRQRRLQVECRRSARLSVCLYLRLPMSGTPDRDSSFGFPPLAPHRHSDRRVRSAAEPWAGSPAHRDHPGGGHPAPLPAGGHTLARPDRHRRSGQRLDPTPLSDTLGQYGLAGQGPWPADRAATPT